MIAVAYKALRATCRYTVKGVEHWQACKETREPFIVAFWHETLGLAACHYRKTAYHTLTSYSFDGELAARVVRHFGLYAVRGSSSRGGTKALGQLERALDFAGVVGFTLDGPRGPRRVAKPGIAILAARTQRIIIPHAFYAAPCWRLNSWDQFIVPKPFGHVVSAFAAPIVPPPDCSADNIEATRLQVERSLNELHDSLETDTTGER